jgi:Protein of unknown function (DUF3606)
VQYWADKFNVSKEQLSEAVKNVGHSAPEVEAEKIGLGMPRAGEAERSSTIREEHLPVFSTLLN